MAQYDFHYLPLEGKITGKQVLQQTEDAINDIGNRIVEIETDTEAITEAVEIAQDAKNTADNAETIANDAMDVAQAERESAQEAAQEANQAATNAANSASSASVTAQQLMEYLATKEEITAPAVDPTLTISGAAADAQVTGDNISALNKNIQSLHAVAISGDLNNKTASTIQGLSVEVDGCVIKLNGTVSGSTSSARYFSLQETPPKGYAKAADFYNGCTISNTLLAGHKYRMHAVLVGGTFTSSDNTYGAGFVFSGTNAPGVGGYVDGHNTVPIITGDGSEITVENDTTVGACFFRATGTEVFNNAVIVAYVEDVTLTSKLNTTDKTLSIDGLSADAKAVAENLQGIGEQVNATGQYIEVGKVVTPAVKTLTTNATHIFRCKHNMFHIPDGTYKSKKGGVTIVFTNGVGVVNGTDSISSRAFLPCYIDTEAGKNYTCWGAGVGSSNSWGWFRLYDDSDNSYPIQFAGADKNDITTVVSRTNLQLLWRSVANVTYDNHIVVPMMDYTENCQYVSTGASDVTLLNGDNTIANEDGEDMSLTCFVVESAKNMANETLADVINAYGEDGAFTESFDAYFTTDSLAPQYFSMWSKYSQGEGVSDVPTIRFQLVNSGDSALYTSPSYNLGSAYEPLMQEWRVPPILGIFNRCKITVTIPEGVTLNIKNIVSHESASARYFDNGIRYCWHGNGYAPSNTDIAFKMGGLLGFHKCVTIPKYTADEVGICYHDESVLSSTASTRHKDGSRIEAGSEDDKSINKFTYAEILEKFDVGYSKSSVEYKGIVIPTLEEFFRICSLTGMEPVLSVHSNSGFHVSTSGNYACTVTEARARWQNIKDLAKKWNVLDKLWVKGGSELQQDARIVLGHDIAGYIFLQGINSSWDMLNQAKNFGFVESSATSITESTYTVRAEFFNTAPNLETKIAQAVAEGFPINIASDTTINGDEMTRLIGLGATEFTLDRHCSIGLCW